RVPFRSNGRAGSRESRNTVNGHRTAKINYCGRSCVIGGERVAGAGLTVDQVVGELEIISRANKNCARFGVQISKVVISLRNSVRGTVCRDFLCAWHGEIRNGRGGINSEATDATGRADIEGQLNILCFSRADPGGDQPAGKFFLPRFVPLWALR